MNEDSASWTNVQHVVDGETVTDTFPATTNRPAITLVATIRRSVGANESPWLTIESLSLSRDGGPVFIPDVEGNFQSTVVRLLPCLTVTSNSFLQSRRAVIPGAQLRVDPEIVRDVHIQTRFYWPDPATIVRNGNTAPLVQFVDTTITGVTTEPIVLHGYFSQTYWPIHHNYYEYLLFDPWLEPGLSSEQRSELAELGIQWLLFWTNPGSGESFSGILYVMDFSGNFRQASQCGPWGCDEDLSSKLAPYGVSEPVGSH